MTEGNDNEMLGQYRRTESGLWLPETLEERAEYDRLARFATVTFGMYGWLQNRSMEVKQAGSGVFVAPNIALTAKHVSQGILSLDPSYDVMHEPKSEREYDVSVRVHQVPYGDQDVSWFTKNNWASRDTDISIVSVFPDTPMAVHIRNRLLPQAYFDWRLEPPPEGAKVEMYGYPKPEVAIEGTAHSSGIYWVCQQATVTDIYEPYRTHGNLTYPCYRLDQPIDHGFSGGPVFYDGALVGIVSVGFEAKKEENIPADQYVASLWPLAIMRCHLNGVWYEMSEMFDKGTITVRDWDRFRGKVDRELCNYCVMKGEKHPYHAVRTV